MEEIILQLGTALTNKYRNLITAIPLLKDYELKCLRVEIKIEQLKRQMRAELNSYETGSADIMRQRINQHIKPEPDTAEPGSVVNVHLLTTGEVMELLFPDLKINTAILSAIKRELKNMGFTREKRRTDTEVINYWKVVKIDKIKPAGM